MGGLFGGHIILAQNYAAEITIPQIQRERGYSGTLQIRMDVNNGLRLLRLHLEADDSRLQITGVRRGAALHGVGFTGPNPDFLDGSGPRIAMWSGSGINRQTGILLHIDFTILEDAPPGHAYINLVLENEIDAAIGVGQPVPISIINGGIEIIPPPNWVDISDPIFATRGDYFDLEINISAANSLVDLTFDFAHSPYLILQSHRVYPEILCDGFINHTSPTSATFGWGAEAENIHRARIILQFAVADNAPLGGRAATLRITLLTHDLGRRYLLTHVRVVENREFTGLLGDLDGDGLITSADADILGRYLIGDDVIIDPRAANLTFARGDSITLTDFVALTRWIDGRDIPERLPGGTFPGNIPHNHEHAEISIDSSIVQIGERVRLGINLDANPGISTLRLFVAFDTSRLKLVDYSGGLEDFDIIGTRMDEGRFGFILHRPYATMEIGTLFYLEFDVLDGGIGRTFVSFVLPQGDDIQNEGGLMNSRGLNGLLNIVAPPDETRISEPVFAQPGDIVEFDVFVSRNAGLEGLGFALDLPDYLTLVEICGYPLRGIYHTGWFTLRLAVCQNAPLAGRAATLPIALYASQFGQNTARVETHVRVVQNREFVHSVGDANGDGTISSADASHLARYLAGHNVVLDPRAVNLTLYRGDEITPNDLISLVNWLVGRGTPERLRAKDY